MSNKFHRRIPYLSGYSRRWATSFKNMIKYVCRRNYEVSFSNPNKAEVYEKLRFTNIPKAEVHEVLKMIQMFPREIQLETSNAKDWITTRWDNNKIG